MSIEAVEYVFEQLAAEYGAAWDRSLGQAPIADVKTRWAHRLSDFTHSPAAKKAVLWALDNLPERIPTPAAFHALCRQAPAQDVRALPAPAADPERVKAELAKLGPMRQAAATPASNRGIGFKSILARHESGAKISPTVLRMAKDGLANLGLSFANQ